jgi:hypothetical protein
LSWKPVLEAHDSGEKRAVGEEERFDVEGSSMTSVSLSSDLSEAFSWS